MNERHAGSGPRGSHQLGKTPIRPFPTAFGRILVSVPAAPFVAPRQVVCVNPILIIVNGTWCEIQISQERGTFNV